MLKNSLSLINNQKGQALLIVVLVMVVALTVGLSVVSRTVTNLKTSSEQVNSQKALSAAEAGVEQVLKNKTNITNATFPNNTTYTTSIVSDQGTLIVLNGGDLLDKDDGVYAWLSAYNSNWTPWSGTDLKFYWGQAGNDCSSSTNPPAALEIDLITGSRANPAITRYAYDPCSRANNFTSATTGGIPNGLPYLYSATIPSFSNGLLVRVIPLYASTYAAVSGISTALPSQGSVVNSTGTSSDTVRKINVFEGFPELPSELFPYSLFWPVVTPAP